MHPTSQERESAGFTLDAALRWASSRWLAFGATGLFALATVPSAAQPPAPQAKSINELKAFYRQNCTRCHGPDGSGRSSDGKKLGGMDFTRIAQDFRARNGPDSEREIRTMIRTIQKGLFFGLTMPAWKDQLSQEDATAMVKEILLKAESGKAIEPGPEAAKSL
ncbi:MAG: cytochrome c [Geothrix sp.]|nr:cytochrome c [Geothrix sp.]